jgi:formate-dependent phosphoribosylglycinamide formyltransferase (GAR transformylase)
LCPIGHRQERGDQESWQPALISDKIYMKHKIWPKKVTEALVVLDFGVEFSWLMMGFTFQNSPPT